MLCHSRFGDFRRNDKYAFRYPRLTHLRQKRNFYGHEFEPDQKLLAMLEDDLIDHPVFLSLFRIHDVVALDVLFDAVDGLTGMFR
jgi:recombinational DNA repair ATPase RecF